MGDLVIIVSLQWGGVIIFVGKSVVRHIRHSVGGDVTVIMSTSFYGGSADLLCVNRLLNYGQSWIT